MNPDFVISLTTLWHIDRVYISLFDRNSEAWPVLPAELWYIKVEVHMVDAPHILINSKPIHFSGVHLILCNSWAFYVENNLCLFNVIWSHKKVKSQYDWWRHLLFLSPMSNVFKILFKIQIYKNDLFCTILLTTCTVNMNPHLHATSKIYR